MYDFLEKKMSRGVYVLRFWDNIVYLYMQKFKLTMFVHMCGAVQLSLFEAPGPWGQVCGDVTDARY